MFLGLNHFVDWGCSLFMVTAVEYLILLIYHSLFILSHFGLFSCFPKHFFCYYEYSYSLLVYTCKNYSKVIGVWISTLKFNAKSLYKVGVRHYSPTSDVSFHWSISLSFETKKVQDSVSELLAGKWGLESNNIILPYLSHAILVFPFMVKILFPFEINLFLKLKKCWFKTNAK